jgi:histidine triad (HIT) family protein
MEDSIFTKIIKGEIPCHKVYENDDILAFLDISPNVVGHTLVVPKAQVDQFNHLDDGTYHAVWAAVKKVANNHQAKLRTDRIGISVKGVDVPHAHVHVLPFNYGEHMGKHTNSPTPTQAELAELATTLRFDD